MRRIYGDDGDTLNFRRLLDCGRGGVLNGVLLSVDRYGVYTAMITTAKPDFG